MVSRYHAKVTTVAQAIERVDFLSHQGGIIK